MSAKTLPARPSLKHLKNEAKQLHKALSAGDAEAAERARANLRRLNGGDAVDDVTLQEAQHVLGREYGFQDWQGLTAAAEFTFDDLARLSDEDTHRLLREVDQRDLVVSLKLATEAVKDRVLTGMSQRVRTFITEEMEFLGPMPVDEIRVVQERIVQQVRLVAVDDVIGWPPGAETPPPKPVVEPDLEPDIAAVIERQLTTLTMDELRAFVRALSSRQQAHGIISLEAAARVAADGFVREALRLAVDGTEAALLEDIMLTRARAMLQSLDNRQRMTIEGLASIHRGDNPRIVVHKVQSIYSTDFDSDIVPDVGSIEELRRHLSSRSVSAMDHDEYTKLLGSLSEVSRRQGIAYLAGLCDVVDDGYLRLGLGLTTGSTCAEMIERLEWRMGKDHADAGVRYQTFTAGITAVQEGRTGGDLEAAMDIDKRGDPYRLWFA